MGTGASGNVKPVETDIDSPNVERPGRPWSSVSAKLRLRKEKYKDVEIEELNLQLTKFKTLLAESEKMTKQTQEENRKLEKQVASLESINLDLIDHIQSLEEQIEHMRKQNILADQNQCSETVWAKNQYILNLERDIIDLQGQNKKLKVLHKKRIRQLNAQLTESKQESSIKLFEIKEEISRLSEENKRLQDNISIGRHTPDVSPVNDDKGGFTSITESLRCSSRAGLEVNRTKIILELSTRVSEQEQEINRLTAYIQNLEQKDYIEKHHNKVSVDCIPDVTSVKHSKSTPIVGSQIDSTHTAETNNYFTRPPKGPQSGHRPSRGYKKSDKRLENNDFSPIRFSEADTSSFSKTEQSDSDTVDELKAIAMEMKMVKPKKKKAKSPKHNINDDKKFEKDVRSSNSESNILNSAKSSSIQSDKNVKKNLFGESNFEDDSRFDGTNTTEKMFLSIKHRNEKVRINVRMDKSHKISRDWTDDDSLDDLLYQIPTNSNHSVFNDDVLTKS